jgi:5-methylcytosine-specific restriction endonuclease McrA
MKVCSKCKVEKDTSLFSKDKYRPDGFTNWCKQCRSNNYQNNREAELVRAKLYASTRKEKYKETSARHYLANRDKVLCRSKETYYANAEAIKARHRANNKVYVKENPEMNLAKTQRRRARKRGNGIFAITKQELKRLYDSSCFYCGKDKAEHLDHVVPLVHGGRHSIGNLVPACSTCNMSKGSKFLSVWKRDRMKYLKGEK